MGVDNKAGWEEMITGLHGKGKPTLLDPENPDEGSVFSFRTNKGVLHVPTDMLGGATANDFVGGSIKLSDGPVHTVVSIEKP